MGLDMYIQNKDNDQYAYWRKANAINGWFDNLFGGVQNVTPYEVNKDILQHLVDDCKYVLDLLKNTPKEYDCNGRDINEIENPDEECSYIYNSIPSEIFQILPPMTGFFFGSYEIDDFYIYKLESTINQLEPLIKYHDFEEEPLFYYIWF